MSFFLCDTGKVKKADTWGRLKGKTIRGYARNHPADEHIRRISKVKKYAADDLSPTF